MNDQRQPIAPLRLPLRPARRRGSAACGDGCCSCYLFRGISRRSALVLRCPTIGKGHLGEFGGRPRYGARGEGDWEDWGLRRAVFTFRLPSSRPGCRLADRPLPPGDNRPGPVRRLRISTGGRPPGSLDGETRELLLCTLPLGGTSWPLRGMTRDRQGACWAQGTRRACRHYMRVYGWGVGCYCFNSFDGGTADLFVFLFRDRPTPRPRLVAMLLVGRVAGQVERRAMFGPGPDRACCARRRSPSELAALGMSGPVGDRRVRFVRGRGPWLGISGWAGWLKGRLAAVSGPCLLRCNWASGRPDCRVAVALGEGSAKTGQRRPELEPDKCPNRWSSSTRPCCAGPASGRQRIEAGLLGGSSDRWPGPDWEGRERHSLGRG